MAGSDFKRCSVCCVSLASQLFAADSRASDGLQPCCRACANAKRRAKRKADPIAAKQRDRAYYAANKHLVLALNAKSRAKNKDSIAAMKKAAYQRDKVKPEFQAKLKARTIAAKSGKPDYDRKYRAENAEKLASLKLAWRAANASLMRAVNVAYKAKRRSQEMGGDSARAVARWLEGARKVCLWCGRNCAENFHVDHFQPLAKGGAHRLSNLVIACPTCNVRKNAMDPEEFCKRNGLDFAAIERHRVDVGMLQ